MNNPEYLSLTSPPPETVPTQEVKVLLLEENTPAELVTRATERLMQIISSEGEEEKRYKGYVFHLLGLEDTAQSEQIAQAFTDRVEFFLEKLYQFKESLPEQLKRTAEWLEDNNLEPSQLLGEVSIYFTDQVLQTLLLPDSPYKAGGGRYLPKYSAVVVNDTMDPSTLSHELGHAMSHNKEAARTGWRYLLDNGEAAKIGNGWLDEGCAMHVEFATSSSTLEKWQEMNGLYVLFYEMTEGLQAELGISDEELLQAYLEDGPTRQEIEGKVQNRYGCSVFDLDTIILGYEGEYKEKTLALLKGEEVMLRQAVYEGSGMEEKYKGIMKIFPNFHWQP